MTKYKNAVLILISIILFAYAAFISIIPSVIANTVNRDKLQSNYLAASGLNVTFDKAFVKIGPTFKTVITLTDLNIEFPDKQPVLHSTLTELTTTPAAIFGKTIDIKNLYMNHVRYDELILPDGNYKLAFLPSVLEPKYVGKNGLTIISGPVKLKNVKIAHTNSTPYSYNETEQKEINLTEAEVRDFLQSQNFAHINIK